VTADLDDDLMPEQSRFDWWYVVVAAVVGQLAVGAPMWYAVYVVGYERSELSAALVDTTMSLPAGEVVILGLLLVLVGCILGPPLALWKHHDELARDGASLGIVWRLVTVCCLMYWPLSVLTALKHYHTRKHIHD